MDLCCTFLVLVDLTKNDEKSSSLHSLLVIINLVIKNCIPPPTYACFYILRYTLLS